MGWIDLSRDAHQTTLAATLATSSYIQRKGGPNYEVASAMETRRVKIRTKRATTTSSSSSSRQHEHANTDQQ